MNFLNNDDMKHTIYIQFIFVFLFFILQSSGCNDVKEPEYKGILNTKLETLNLSNAGLRVDLGFYNPNDFALDIKGTDLSVYINDRFIAFAEQPTKTKIPKKSDFIFPVTTHFNPIDVLGVAFKNILSKSVKISVQGSAKVGKGGVYIRIPINYSDNVPVKF
ncbi:MAG: Water Stress and Hypersensitive response domain-containing protein [Bacteroidetes bacterium OLB11]|mgnify:CR=1 FL=1|nr:MAG: Water Stress and Hypersensitive response domain-containing protein [Bacteroidetes bacterium OLB11]